MLPSKAINIYFGKLLFCTNQHELSFVIIKFELIRKHPRTNVDIQRSMAMTASV